MRRGVQFAFWLAVAALAMAALGPYRTQVDQLFTADPIVAQVNEHRVPQSKLADALRDQLWRRGESWSALAPGVQQQLRESTLQHLINAALLHTSSASSPVKTEDELLWFQRQLDFQQGRYASSLESQQLAEPQLRQQIAAQLQDQALIESKLDFTISEDEARVWFDTHHDRLQVPETWRAAHLFLSNHDPDKPDRHDEIHAIARQISTGAATFEDLIAKHSEDDRTKLRSGDLGWFSSERMPPDFIAVVRSLAINKLSEPTQTKLGWHLIKLLDHKPARQLNFDEAKPEIIAHLQNQRRAKDVSRQIEELRKTATIMRNDDMILSTVPAP